MKDSTMDKGELSLIIACDVRGSQASLATAWWKAVQEPRILCRSGPARRRADILLCGRQVSYKQLRLFKFASRGLQEALEVCRITTPQPKTWRQVFPTGSRAV